MSLLLRLLIGCIGIDYDLAMSTIRCLCIRLLVVVVVARIFIRLLRVLILIVGLIIITTTSGTSTTVCICAAASTLVVLVVIASWVVSLIATLIVVARVILSLSVASVLGSARYYRLDSSLYFLECSLMLRIVWFLVPLFRSLRLQREIVWVSLCRRFLLFFNLRHLFTWRDSKRLDLCNKLFPEAH